MDNEKDLELDCNGECDGCDGCDDADNIVTLTDEETGEEFQFAHIDSFDYKDKNYAVLITLDEEPEMIIFEEIEEDGIITIASLDESEEDELYDYYDSLCDEMFDDEDDAEE